MGVPGTGEPGAAFRHNDYAYSTSQRPNYSLKRPMVTAGTHLPVEDHVQHQ